MSSSFERDTTVTSVGGGRYKATIVENWTNTGGPNGGFTAALLLRTAISHLDDAAMQPRSFTTHLIGAPAVGPCELTAVTERHGRTAGFVTVRLTQSDRIMATASVVFVGRRPALEPFTQRAMPNVASAHALVNRRDVRREVPRYIAHYDQRFWTPDLTGDGVAKVIGWTRFVDAQPFDAVAIVAIADSFPPPLLARTYNVAGALTLDYTVHFRTELPAAATSADGFVLMETESNFCQEGLVEEDGWIWAPNGTLLAQARQLGLMLATNPENQRGEVSP